MDENKDKRDKYQLENSELFNGAKTPKDAAVFDALGTIDELIATIGMAREHCKVSANGLESYLQKIQGILFDVNSSIASPINSSPTDILEKTKFDPSHVEFLRKLLVCLKGTLPKIENFIVPSGCLSATSLHVARTLSRKTERLMVPLLRDGAIPMDVAKFLNKLSNLLFVFARIAAVTEIGEEVIYQNKTGITKLPNSVFTPCLYEDVTEDLIFAQHANSPIIHVKPKPIYQKSTIYTWNVNDVCRWALTLSLSKDYSVLLVESNINGEVLMSMTKEDWKEIGIVTFGDVALLYLNVGQFL